MTAPDWSLANCLNGDPDAFFPTANGNTADAKAVCRPCLIRAACGLYAIEHRLEGVWGGLSDRDRDGLRRKERRAVRDGLRRRQARAQQKANQARKVTA